MENIKTAGLREPVRTRTIAIFSGTTTNLLDHLQPAIEASDAAYHDATRLVAFILRPASVLALAFGLWRLTSDLDWTSNFPIANGLFSHWIVWAAMAIGLHMVSSFIESASNNDSNSQVR